MKAVVLRGPGQLACENVADPELTPDGLILRIEACGICGSDVRAYRHGFRYDIDWQILGHEIAGVVEAVGKNVADYRPGDRLAVAADVSCRRCFYCQRGLFNLCENWQLIGAHFPGGMAEFMAVPEAILRRGIVHRRPAQLDGSAGALAEPASSVLAAQSRVDVQPGETVVIIGDGPIGALHVQVARARGAVPVLVGRSADRLDMIRQRQLGAAHILNSSEVDLVSAARELTGGRGPDVAIIACASREAQADAVNMVRKRGRVVLFGGLPKQDPITHLDSNRIHYDELEVIGTFSYHPGFHATALDWIARRDIEARKLVTATYPLEQIQAALAAVTDRRQLKVMLKPAAAPVA